MIPQAHTARQTGRSGRGGARFCVRCTFPMMLVAAALLLALAGCFAQPFEIGGAWKSVGDQAWGVVAPGTVVRFGDTVNLFSPWDTWLYEEDGPGGGELTVTGLLGGTYTFDVNVIDNDHIELVRDSYTLELERSE